MKFWNRKKDTVSLNRVIDISNKLTLSYINLYIYFKPYQSSESYNGELQYYEHPEASYTNRGTDHTVQLKANSWPELRDQIDELLKDEL